MSGTSKLQPPASDQLARLLGGAILLVMIDYGRAVLIPIVLAIFLALLISPLVQRLRHWGLGQVQAVAAAVLLLFVTVAATAVVLGSQAIELASSLPQHEQTIRNKLQSVDKLTLGKLDAIVSQADHLVSKLSPTPPAPGAQQSPNAQQTMRVEIAEPHAKPFEIISKLIETVLPPLETGGIVFIVLVFILLDYDLLRDRVIRLVSGGNLRGTTQAITDATERLSRFFVSQFAVNALVGVLVAAGLAIAGLSGALFWGVLTAVARFIPYIGIWLAAGAAIVMSAAMSDGWGLMFATVFIYLFIEIVIAQFFEPKLYGHSTGLSPLSVIISAIFWSAMWGPAGLILSTPLTLCLVVAGRHVRALNFLEVLLGDLSALSQAERFYQRALSGDSAELVRGLRSFLKDKPLRQYADQIILASFHLAHVDFSEHEITTDENEKMNRSVRALIEAMSHKRKLRKRGRLGSVLAAMSPDSSPELQRKVTPVINSPVIVTDLADGISDLIAKIMVNVLHSENIEARYLARKDIHEIEANNESSLIFVACLAPKDHPDALSKTIAELRRQLPEASVVVMRVLEEVEASFAHPTADESGADEIVGSYQEVIESCYRRLRSVSPDGSLPSGSSSVQA